MRWSLKLICRRSGQRQRDVARGRSTGYRRWRRRWGTDDDVEEYQMMMIRVVLIGCIRWGCFDVLLDFWLWWTIVSLRFDLNPRAKKCRLQQAVNDYQLFYDGFLRCGMHLCRILHVGSRCIVQREGPHGRGVWWRAVRIKKLRASADVYWASLLTWEFL